MGGGTGRARGAIASRAVRVGVLAPPPQKNHEQ